jgi:hypothetical protein
MAVSRRHLLQSAAALSLIYVLQSQHTLAEAQPLLQVASPVSDTMQREIVVEMTILPEQMPENLVKALVDIHTVQPGIVAEFGWDDEGIRGRSMYLLAGTLIVEPLLPSPVWWASSPIGADPEIVQPGDSVELNVGDSMYLPAMNEDVIGENDRILISNPGDVEAVQIGIHLHEEGGGFSGPIGYDYSHGAGYYDPDGLEQMKAGATLIRVTDISAEPGTLLPFAEGAIATYYQIVTGEVTQSVSGTAINRRWPAGMTKVIDAAEPASELHVTSGEPAHVIEFAVIPSASGENGMEPSGIALFEIALAPAMIPNPMEHVIFERLNYEPGADFTVAGTEEWIRGRAQLVETGSLTITPIADSYVWRSGQNGKEDPETIPSGEAAVVAVGDLIYLPAIPQDETVGLGDYRIMSSSDGGATTIGFHLHEPGSAPFTGLPSALTSNPETSMGTLNSLQPLADAGGVVTLREIVLQPGECLPVSLDSVVTGYEVVSGTANYEMTKTGNATPNTELTWREGTLQIATPYEGVDQIVVNHGDEPITVRELTFVLAEG